MEEEKQVEEQPNINDLLGYGMSQVIPNGIDFLGKVDEFTNSNLEGW